MADSVTHSGNADVVDAEFETLGRNGRPQRQAAPEADTARDVHASRIGLLSGKVIRKPSDPMPLPLFAAIATLSACTAFYFAGGRVLFERHAAPAATGVQLAPVTTAAASAMALENVSVRIDTAAGRAVYVIRAMIENTSAHAAAVPPVTITFSEPGGASVTHTVPRGETLRAGERMAFTTRIPAGDYLGMEPRLGFGAGS